MKAVIEARIKSLVRLRERDRFKTGELYMLRERNYRRLGRHFQRLRERNYRGETRQYGKGRTEVK